MNVQDVGGSITLCLSLVVVAGFHSCELLPVLLGIRSASRVKAQAWILSCCHSQEVMLSRGTNGAIHCNRPLSVHRFPVVFISACLLLQKACSEKACSEKGVQEKRSTLCVDGGIFYFS